MESNVAALTDVQEKGADDDISAEIPDWSRETPQRFWDPGRKLLLTIRRYQYWRGKQGLIPFCLCKWLVLRHHFWTIITGAEIALNSQIGGGLLIPHPNGIVIHPAAKIGVNCLIFQQVTIGSSGSAVPVLGGHVDVCAGAKILGGVHVGDHAVIGANSLVIADVPARSTAIGVPARTMLRPPREMSPRLEVRPPLGRPSSSAAFDWRPPRTKTALLAWRNVVETLRRLAFVRR
jgi:serine O-acetyltransferase